MKKIIFALASALTVSALSGCGSDPEEVALGMVKAIVSGDAEKAASYCSPEEKTRCNINEAKSTIEYYPIFAIDYTHNLSSSHSA